MPSVTRPFHTVHRLIRKAKANPRTTIILFDHFGVIGLDPLTKWKEDNHLTPSQIRQVGHICDQIDAGKIDMESFYQKLADLIGQKGSSVKAALGRNAGYDPDMLQLLKQLRQQKNIRLGLVSNADKSLHQGLWKDGVHQLFDDVVTSQELRGAKPKPDPDFFRLAVHRLGGHRSNTIFFDDRLPNVQGAKQAGLQAHLFTTAAHCKSTLHDHGIFN